MNERARLAKDVLRLMPRAATSMKRKEAVLLRWLSDVDASPDAQPEDIAARWLVAKWLGWCHDCRVNVWYEGVKPKQFICPTCQGELLPF